MAPIAQLLADCNNPFSVQYKSFVELPSLSKLLQEKQEDPKTDEKPVDEEPEEKVDTIAEALKETGEALKTQVEHINEIPNGKVRVFQIQGL